ncbi:MAG: ribokinase [Paracoccaceae bacterium]
MAVWNLGSINIDRFYRLPHLPAAGETLAASGFDEGLGGKGANMSVAIARAAAHVCQIGAVGSDGRWARDRLLEYGVDTRHIAQVDGASGHANINVDASGENQIVLYQGANHEISSDQIALALAEANTNDTFLTQNETNGQRAGAELAKQMGLRVVYAAAPFQADAVADVLDLTDLLVLNEIEAQQLEAATQLAVDKLPVENVVVTLGGKGARWYDQRNAQMTDVAAYPVTPVDTTGAGDTFTGFLVAGLDRGLPMLQALDLASRAAAIMVTREGTADVIPDLKDIEDARFA